MPKFEIQTSRRVDKFLEKHRDIASKFVQALEILEVSPYENSLDIKKLQGQDDSQYRLRIGKYRFLYKIFEERILIYFYDAGGRGDIYK